MASAASPFIIPVFISHQGCPHRCIFCNQHAITGHRAGVTARQVAETIERYLALPRQENRTVQVAFYGGSFTGLPRARQEELLGAVRVYLERGEVEAIRLSTRPDYVDGEVVHRLVGYGVQVVELGVQSMADRVLAEAGRGQTAAQAEQAFDLLQAAGLTVGGQLMLGLPGETTAGHLHGIRRLLELRPDFIRLYPALVLRDSRLAELYHSGQYRPLSLNKAVALAARMKTICDRQGVRMVRMGLQSSPDLEHSILAGPWHPAFGELVLARQLFGKARRMLAGGKGPARCLTVAAADESVFRGPGNRSLKRLADLGLLVGTTIEYRADQPRQTVFVS